MKLEVVVDGKGLPLGTVVAAANIAETALAEPAIDDAPIELPANVPLLADKGYDSDPLRDQLAKRKIVLLSPHRKGRTKSCRNDGRRMRRYARRYVIERTNAWIHCFRRLAHRWEYHTFMYTGFLRIACILLASARL